MGHPDLASNSLTSYADVFADIINAVVYGGKPVLLEQNLKPFYLNSAVEKDGRLKGLYRDNCMEDIRNRIRYAIWGLENQYVPDRTTPFKSMGYTYTAYDRQIEEFLMRNKETHNSAYVSQLHPDQKLVPVITLVLYYGGHLFHDTDARGRGSPKIYPELQSEPDPSERPLTGTGGSVSVGFFMYCQIPFQVVY